MRKMKKGDLPFVVRIVLSVLCLSAVLLHNYQYGISITRDGALLLGILCLISALLPIHTADKQRDKRGNALVEENPAQPEDELISKWTQSHTSLVVLALYGICVLILFSVFLPKPDRMSLFLLAVAALPWLRICLQAFINGGKQALLAYSLLFALACLAGIVTRIAFSTWTVDTTSIILLVLMVVPLMLPRLKSLEMSGVFKAEFISREERESQESIAPQSERSVMTVDAASNGLYAFVNYRYTSPKLALAGLRYAIEITLREKYINKRESSAPPSAAFPKTFPSLLDQLTTNQVITKQLASAMQNLFRLIDRLVFSRAKVIDSSSFDWLFDQGVVILYQIIN